MLDEFKNSTIKYLYFGSSEKDLSEITDGKFLTTFFPIACCFAISIDDIYGELNKRYYSINFGHHFLYNLSAFWDFCISIKDEHKFGYFRTQHRD